MSALHGPPPVGSVDWSEAPFASDSCSACLPPSLDHTQANSELICVNDVPRMGVTLISLRVACFYRK